MNGERLREYDLDLCDYVLGQIRSHLGSLGKRPRTAKVLHPEEWSRMTMPTWVGWKVAALPNTLADHIWAGVAGDRVVLPLTDAELFRLEEAMIDPPMHLEDKCAWEPYPALHRREIECVPEIRSALPQKLADEWVEDSVGFAARLSADGLSLADGIATVQEWLWCVRRLSKVMGAIACLPDSAGTRPTHTDQNPRQAHSGDKCEPASKNAGFRNTTVIGTGPSILTPEQVATRYKMSRSTVYGACRSGMLTHMRVSARPGARGKYLIHEGDLLAWLDSLRVAPAPVPPSVSAPTSSGSQAGPFSELNPRRLARAWSSG